MKAGHTAGPWSHELCELCDGFTEDGKKINPRTIKDYYAVTAGERFWREEDNTKGFNLTGYMSEANARLIAAAPELLEALESLMGMAEDGYELHKRNASHQEFLEEDREALHKAKTAINKAKGQ